MATKGMDRLYAERIKLWQELVKYRDIMRGSMVTLKRPCTYKGCRKCRDGTKHPTRYYSISRKNKTELVYLPKDMEEAVTEQIGNYRRVMEAIDQMSEIGIKILRLRIQERRTKR